LNNTASGFLTYRSPLYGVKIDYPDGSEIHEETNKIYVTIPSNVNDPYYSNSLLLPKVIIETNMEVQANMSLDTWTRQLISLSIHRADPNPMAFKIISINKTKISDGLVNANLTLYGYTFGVSYSTHIEAVHYKELLLVTIKDGSGYTISFTGNPEQFDIYYPTVKKMINSFELVGLT
jgi:hypothetical protein